MPAAAIPRIRPFLHLLRAQLERYARSRALRWIEDESNMDTRYARNALRHDVIPALSVHFPGFRDALARTAAHAASAQRPVRIRRQAEPAPARPRPGARSARRQRWRFHSIADHT